jgi:hypothetical protein
VTWSLAVYLNEAPGARRGRPCPAAVEALWQETIEEANAMLDLTGEPEAASREQDEHEKDVGGPPRP